MKRSIVTLAVLVTALAVCTNLSVAAESKPVAPGEAKATQNAGVPAKSAKRKGTAAKIKLVDINSASKAALMKLQGIDAAMADKIIAGRPYLSKAHLVTRQGLPRGIYEQIKGQIIAVQKPTAGKK